MHKVLKHGPESLVAVYTTEDEYAVIEFRSYDYARTYTERFHDPAQLYALYLMLGAACEALCPGLVEAQAPGEDTMPGEKIRFEADRLMRFL